MVGNLKSPWENGLDGETRVALALMEKDVPMRLAEVARKANLVKQHAKYGLERLQVKGGVLLDEKTKTWRLQPMFFRKELDPDVQAIYDAIMRFKDHAAQHVINPRKDPEILMQNVGMMIQMLALDLEDKLHR